MTSGQVEDPAGQVYKDPQGRFSFTIPSNWTLAQPAGAEVAFQARVKDRDAVVIRNGRSELR